MFKLYYLKIFNKSSIYNQYSSRFLCTFEKATAVFELFYLKAPPKKLSVKLLSLG